MSKFTISIEDKDDEVVLTGTIDPFMEVGRLAFTTAEIVGLYLQDNIAKIVADAIKWAQTPNPAEEASRILLPGAEL